MFNPKELPAKVRVAWQQDAANWMGVVEAAISVQMTEIKEVTDVVFHLRHKERKVRPLNPSDIGLIAEWRALHTLVKARLYGGQNVPIRGRYGVDQIANFGNGNAQAPGTGGGWDGFGWDRIGDLGGGNANASGAGRMAFPLYQQAIFTNDTIK